MLLNKLISFGWSLIPFIIVLTIIVFIHELGHFLIARANGVHVTAFSIGYGPEIFGWTDKKGTRWKFSWIPLGGYVMMLGDADPSSVKSKTDKLTKEEYNRTLTSKTPFQRIMVAFGGPLMNFIFSLFIFAFIGLWKGIPDMEPKIQSVVEGSIADVAGLKSGDIITGLNEDKIKLLSEMKRLLEKNSGSDVILHYKRGDENLSSNVQLYENVNGIKTPIKMLGISLSGNLVFTKANVLEAVLYGVKYCYASAVAIFSGIGKAIFGKKDGAKLGGILSIGDVANKSMSGGFITFLNFLAMLSFSLGIFNLFPIPVLDGGSIVLNFVELVRGKPLSASAINVIYSLGLAAVLSLMIWATWNDFVNYGIVSKISSFFKNIFN